MIDFDLQFQVALFGNYEDITPTPEALKTFIDAFADKNLIPSTIQEVELINNQVRTVNRMGMRSSDNAWNIAFNTNRIDIVKNNVDIGVTQMGTLKQFIAEVKQITEVINTSFPKKHHRLALITRYMLRQMEPDEMNVIYSKVVKATPFYHKYPPETWNIRSIARIPSVIEKDETINSIAELQRLNGTAIINSKNEPIDRIELKLDVNTWHGDTEYRFQQAQVLKFLDIAESIEETLKTEHLQQISVSDGGEK